jgi:5-methylcytosine-specific restriction protein A
MAGPTFRNPDGVGFKLMNIRHVATGKGLGKVSEMARRIWADFGDRPEEVYRLAGAIKDAMVAVDIGDLPDVDEEHPEGRLLTALHIRRERNPKVRKMLLSDRRPDGLRCEICSIARPDLELTLQEVMFEAHHLIPLAEAGDRKTRLNDLALLCACCHRLNHRKMIISSGWIGIVEARSLLASS